MQIKKVFSILFAVFLLIAPCAFSQEEPDLFEIHFLSVGTNDAILLRCGDECAFIDSGNYPEGEKCVEYLKKMGVLRLKYYIGSHAHLDHVGGAPVIVSEIPTESVIYTYDKALDAMYKTAKTDEQIQALDALQRCPINYGDTYMLGDVKLTCVGPESYVPKYDLKDTSENNNSMLLHVTFGNFSVFLTGDSPSWKVLEMHKNHPEVLKSTVIKAPHHRGGFDKSVYKLMDTGYVVFSTADTWLPLRDQMEMAMQSSESVLITADNRNGNIVFMTDGETVTVRTQFEYDYAEK